jgi:microcystin-dependent protein
MALQFIITDAGRAAIAQVGGAIGPVTLTKIAIGSAGYTPTASRTSLQAEIKRLDPSGSSVPVPGTIHLTTQDDSADSYSVKEIGLYTNNGVLFAIYSQTGVILTKGSTASALFALDFVMTNVPPGSVTVGDAGFSYAQANETRLGVLAIATTAEAQAGTVDNKIITPLKLAQVTATESRRGVIALATTTEAQALAPDATKALTVARLVDRTATTGRAGVVVLASSTETQTGTDANKAVTPASLASRTATDARAGIVELADNTETQTGTDATRAVTPASLASRTATDARAGIVELADNTETQTGTDATRAVTPASLASRTATDARAGIVELATNAETQTGTDTARAVTPAGLASAAVLFVPPGAVMPFAMNTAPSGWLAANGSAVSRTTYAALFAAIGTTYGAGNGSTTFTLPDLRGYFVRGSGTNSDGVAAGTFGAKQADGLISHTHSGTTGNDSPDHTHSTTFRNNAESTGLGSPSATGGTLSTAAYSSGGASARHQHDFTTSSQSPAGTTETRPCNIALLYCIKF